MSLKNYVKNVACLSPRSSIYEASQEMKGKDIGALVAVSDDHKPIGLVTDRDITLRVVAEGKSPNQTTIEEVMSHGVLSLPAHASLQAVTELMRQKGVRRIVVTDEDGRVAGLISLDDVLLLLGIELGNLASAVFNEMSRSSQAEPLQEGPAT